MTLIQFFIYRGVLLHCVSLTQVLQSESGDSIKFIKKSDLTHMSNITSPFSPSGELEVRFDNDKKHHEIR